MLKFRKEIPSTQTDFRVHNIDLNFEKGQVRIKYMDDDHVPKHKAINFKDVPDIMTKDERTWIDDFVIKLTSVIFEIDSKIIEMDKFSTYETKR